MNEHGLQMSVEPGVVHVAGTVATTGGRDAAIPVLADPLPGGQIDHRLPIATTDLAPPDEPE